MKGERQGERERERQGRKKVKRRKRTDLKSISITLHLLGWLLSKKEREREK